MKFDFTNVIHKYESRIDEPDVYAQDWILNNVIKENF